ncbi:hypothetical protein pb186bvf_004303 [Paramecium bursaria]
MKIRHEIKREYKFDSGNEDESNESDQKNSQSFRNLRKKIIKTHPAPKQIVQSQKIKQFFKEGKLRELVKLVEADKIHYQEYDQLKQNNNVIKLQQNALIVNQTNSREDFVGKIIKIITIKESKSNKLICLCEVNWYFRRNEVVKYAPDHKKWISNQEVFASTHVDIIRANSIIKPCEILSIEDYEKLHSVDKGVFFQRLSFNIHTKKIEGLQNLKLMCTCKKPQNPDLGYIQCDKCDEWYHYSCVGINKSDYENKNKEYVCGCCR